MTPDARERLQHLRDLALRADALAGEQLERRIMAHHRRRLGRLGHQQALAAPAGGWAAAGAPPRPGNRFELFVDGEEALAAIAEAIEAARSSVLLAGWFFS